MNKFGTALLAGACSLALAPISAQAGVSVGDQAPEISAGAWYNLPGGMSKVSLKSLKGQIVVLDFWATW